MLTHSATAAITTDAATASHTRRDCARATEARHSACTAARTAAFMSSGGCSRPPAARSTRAMPDYRRCLFQARCDWT